LGRIEAVSLRILELESDVVDAQQALDDAQTSGDREQLQIVLDGAIEAYRIAVDDRCTQESYKIPELSEFSDAFHDLNQAEDKYADLVNAIGHLNRDLAQSSSDAYKHNLRIEQLTSLLEGLQENLKYFEGLYSDLWDELIKCFDPFRPDNHCDDHEIARLEFFLFWYFLAISAYRDAISEVLTEIGIFEGKLAAAELEIERLTTAIEAEESKQDAAKDALDEARKEYQAVVTALRPLTDICDPRQFATEQSVVDDAIKAIGAYDIEIARLKGMLALAQAHLLSAELQRERLQKDAEEALIYRESWCVDLTTDAAGSAGTIEVPGEPQNVLIVPGASAPTAGDGFLLARAAMTPAQSAANIALLPGWQKWKPMYRVGTLVDKDDDLNAGSVDLDDARSSATGIGTFSPITGADWGGPEGDPAGLQVNQDPLGWIGFQYMDCDSLAFEVGDRVVVKFSGQNWGSPLIIGFESHPRSCEPPTWGPVAYQIAAVVRGDAITDPPRTTQYYIMQLPLTDPLYWAWEQWDNQYSSVFCQDCWKAGTISYSPNYLRVRPLSASAVVVERFQDRAAMTYTVENPGNAQTIKQFEDGTECDPNISFCPNYPTRDAHVVAESIEVPTTFVPRNSPVAARVIALFGIPETNSFHRSHERGRAVLTGIQGSSFPGSNAGWVNALYAPPEDP